MIIGVVAKMLMILFCILFKLKKLVIIAPYFRTRFQNCNGGVILYWTKTTMCYYRDFYNNGLWETTANLNQTNERAPDCKANNLILVVYFILRCPLPSESTTPVCELSLDQSCSMKYRDFLLY